MTERLIHRSFLARIRRACRPHGRRRRHRSIILDRTAFYPTSGSRSTWAGSATCRSTSSRTRMVRCAMSSGLACSPASSVTAGETIHGVIDGAALRPHAATHRATRPVGCLRRPAPGADRGFHLGASSSTIDLAREVSRRPRQGGSGREPHRMGGPSGHDSLRGRGRSGEASHEKRIGARRRAAADRRRDRPLGPAAAAHVARTSAIGIIAIASWEKFAAGPGRVRLRRPGAARVSCVAGYKRQKRPASLRSRP